MADAVRTVEIKVEETGAGKATDALKSVTGALAGIAGAMEAAKIAQQVFNDAIESSTFLLDAAEDKANFLGAAYEQFTANIAASTEKTVENTEAWISWGDVFEVVAGLFLTSGYAAALREAGEAGEEAGEKIRELGRLMELQEITMSQRQLQIRQAITDSRNLTLSEEKRAEATERLGWLIDFQAQQIQNLNDKRREQIQLAIDTTPEKATERLRVLRIELLRIQQQEAQQLQSLEFFRRAYNMALNKSGNATKGDDSTAGALMQVKEEALEMNEEFVMLNGELFLVTDSTRRLGVAAGALADEYINQNLQVSTQIPLLQQQNAELEKQVQLKSILSGLGTIASFIPGLGQITGALRIGTTALSLFGEGGAFGDILGGLFGGGSGGFGGAVGSGPLLPGAATQTANVLVTEDLTRVTSRVNITENRATL